MALNDGEIAIVKGMLLRGDRQHINRIAEISTGQTGSSIIASPAAEYMAGRSALRARDSRKMTSNHGPRRQHGGYQEMLFWSER